MPRHTCHAYCCATPVARAKFMCLKHWIMVPTRLQRGVWTNYRKGQEIDKRPTPEYLRVTAEAIRIVALREGFVLK